VSPNARWLATYSQVPGPKEDYETLVWDLPAGRIVHRFPMRAGGCHLVFSGDSRYLLGTNSLLPPDNTATVVWNVATGKPWRSLDHGKNSASAAAFSPDGRMVATSNNKIIHLRELATGGERRQFCGHESRIDSLAFSPDSRLLAASSYDAAAYTWDVTGRLTSPPRKLESAELNRAWNDLAVADAAAAFDAIRLLAIDPERALPFLRERVKPVPKADSKKVTDLLRDLDSRKFADCRHAATELAKIADQTADTLREELKTTSSAEVRRQLHAILEGLETGTPEMLHGIRAVEVLEMMATPAAEKMLAELGTGAQAFRLTREAVAARDRLRKMGPAGR